MSRLTDTRVAAGLSLGQAAKLLGVYRDTLAYFEDNEGMLPELLHKLADAYGVSVAFLAGREPQDMIEDLIVHTGETEIVLMEVIAKWVNPKGGIR